jgi:dienelactone hydrolase
MRTSSALPAAGLTPALTPARIPVALTLTLTLTLTLALALAAAAPAAAAIHTETVEYTVDAKTLKGYLAYDDAVAGKRPGVVVVHEWWGLNDYARHRAEMLAEEGYVAFAADMYGDGKTTTHPEEAGMWSSAVRQNQEAGKKRFEAARELLAADPHTDPERIAAIGYCFGGAVVLTAALAGADLDAVVSFHGALPTDPPAGPVKASVLVCHGADDQFTTAEQVATFQGNLEAAGADWEFVTYGGAKHSFTNPNAGDAGMDALAYDETADRRSWRAMLDLFDEVFGR